MNAILNQHIIPCEVIEDEDGEDRNVLMPPIISRLYEDLQQLVNEL